MISPTPWILVKGTDWVEIHSAPDPATGLRTQIAFCDHSDSAIDNATVMHAAPELLAALKVAVQIVNAVYFGEGFRVGVPAPVDAMDQFVAAISKAEGR